MSAPPVPNKSSSPKRVLILVENLPVPFDRRVWQEATTLRAHGWQVSVICITGDGYEKTHEIVDGIHIYRYPLPTQGDGGALGYLIEYSAALWHTFRLTFRVRKRAGVSTLSTPATRPICCSWWQFFSSRFFSARPDSCSTTTTSTPPNSTKQKNSGVGISSGD